MFQVWIWWLISLKCHTTTALPHLQNYPLSHILCQQVTVDDCSRINLKSGVNFAQVCGFCTTSSPEPVDDQTSLSTTNSAGCGGTYSSESGIIEHPSTSGDYGNNEDCIWIINSPTPLFISFTRFSIEQGLDYLYIQQGNNSGSPMLETFSGSTLPTIFTTEGDAYIRFTSDWRGTDTGFVLHWDNDCSLLCRNGECTVSNICECNQGWTGITCDSPVCDPTCINGKCSSPNVCTCLSGWTGNYCQTPVCDPTCENGECSIPNVCNCLPGWTGNHCQTLIKWREDKRCGAKFLAPNGKVAECDPLGVAPCCSARGWCGGEGEVLDENGDSYCTCPKCIDYSSLACETPPGSICTQALICGSDGQTYSDGCAFSEAQCHNPQLQKISCYGG